MFFSKKDIKHKTKMTPKIITDVDYVTSESDELEKSRQPISDGCDGGRQARRHWRSGQLVWINVVRLLLLHCVAAIGVCCLPYAKPYTWIWGKFFTINQRTCSSESSSVLARGVGMECVGFKNNNIFFCKSCFFMYFPSCTLLVPHPWK